MAKGRGEGPNLSQKIIHNGGGIWYNYPDRYFLYKACK